MPELCADHLPVIAAAADKDFIGDRESERLAASIARQCPQCVTANQEKP